MADWGAFINSVTSQGGRDGRGSLLKGANHRAELRSPEQVPVSVVRSIHGLCVELTLHSPKKQFLDDSCRLCSTQVICYTRDAGELFVWFLFFLKPLKSSFRPP